MPPRAWPLRRPRVLPGGVSASARRRNDPVFFLCARLVDTRFALSGSTRGARSYRWCGYAVRRPSRGPRAEPRSSRCFFRYLFAASCVRRHIHSAVTQTQIARARRTALVSPSSILTFLYSQSLCGLGPGSRAGAGPMSRPFPGIRHGLAQPAAAGIHHTIARWTIRSWAMDAGRWHAARRSNRRSHSLRQHQSAKNG